MVSSNWHVGLFERCPTETLTEIFGRGGERNKWSASSNAIQTACIFSSQDKYFHIAFLVAQEKTPPLC